MKAFKGGYSLTSCKKNVWIQLHYRAALLEENAATKLLVSCFLPFKAICLLSKSRNPQPQLSQSLYLSEHGKWSGKCMHNCVPPTKSGRRGRAVREWWPGPACLMLHILQSRWGNRASFYWLSQETTRKPPFNFLPYPPASFRLAPRLGERFFLKAIMRNSSSHSKSVLLWANSPCFSPFPCCFLLLAEAAIFLNVL